MHQVKPWKPRTSLKKTKTKVEEEIEEGKGIPFTVFILSFRRVFTALLEIYNGAF